MTAATAALTDPDAMIDSLAASHELLDRLDTTGLTAPTRLPGWSVAQVLSHLGSGAEIGTVLVGRALDGATDTVDRHVMTGIWDRWNAMTPQEQADGRREQDARHLALLQGLTPGQRRHLRVPYFVGPLDVAEYTGYRLSEHAVHTWDVAVALDPSARLAPGTAAVLWARLGLIAGRFHAADVRVRLAPADVTLRPTDGAPAATLVIRPDTVALVDGDHGTAQVRGTVDALVRLCYGRLDPELRDDDRLDVTAGVSRADLTDLFPGY
jgi:uncharacterized protein (TIGR03083 family)